MQKSLKNRLKQQGAIYRAEPLDSAKSVYICTAFQRFLLPLGITCLFKKMQKCAFLVRSNSLSLMLGTEVYWWQKASATASVAKGSSSNLRPSGRLYIFILSIILKFKEFIFFPVKDELGFQITWTYSLCILNLSLQLNLMLQIEQSSDFSGRIR